MLAFLRLRASRVALRPSLSLPLRTPSTEAPTPPRVKGHERKHCPSPDSACIRALKTALIKWCVFASLLCFYPHYKGTNGCRAVSLRGEQHRRRLVRVLQASHGSEPQQRIRQNLERDNAANRLLLALARRQVPSSDDGDAPVFAFTRQARAGLRLRGSESEPAAAFRGANRSCAGFKSRNQPSRGPCKQSNLGPNCVQLRTSTTLHYKKVKPAHRESTEPRIDATPLTFITQGWSAFLCSEGPDNG
ncbi:hypothetical protein B0H17DRAFT_1333915, partial [Mycena rosella]